MAVRRATVERLYGTLNAWMGATHFTMKMRERVGTEMSLQVLAYNIKRVLKIMGVQLQGAVNDPYRARSGLSPALNLSVEAGLCLSKTRLGSISQFRQRCTCLHWLRLPEVYGLPYRPRRHTTHEPIP